jgi:arylsulfatase A-like enzyme
MQWTRRDGTPVSPRDASKAGFRDGFDVDFSRPVSGGPTTVGFDSYFGISASMDMSPYCFIENQRTVGTPDVKSPESKGLFLNQVPGVTTRDFTLEGVLPALTARATSFIQQQKGASKPFFLYLPLNSPHLPIVPTPEFEGRSKAGRYGDFVAETDASIGKVLEALDQVGVADNTLVLFTSDNGGLWHWWKFEEADDVAYGKITPRGQNVQDFGHQSNGTLRGTKADIWEGGHRVPFIVRWPGKIKSGGVSNELVGLVDVLATCAEITGAKLPRDAAEDSFSLLPALLSEKPAKAVRDHAVFHSNRGMFSIEEGDWKLILQRGSGGFSVPRLLEPKPGEAAGQLYNLHTDPRETRNVYKDHPEIVARLTARLEKIRAAGRSRPL